MPARRIQNQTLSHCSGCRAEWEEFDRFYSSVDEFVLISSATSAFILASYTVTCLFFIQIQDEKPLLRWNLLRPVVLVAIFHHIQIKKLSSNPQSPTVSNNNLFVPVVFRNDFPLGSNPNNSRSQRQSADSVLVARLVRNDATTPFVFYAVRLPLFPLRITSPFI